jgi:2,3-bisphosphoglycerate-dependent phosphoglycerate mutase
MNTYIYMVRHGESPKIGDESTRGLTEKGKLEAERIADLLKSEQIDTVISSPYKRSILTVQKLADEIGKEVIVFEDLKERVFSAEGSRMPDNELLPLLKKSFKDENYALTGGESNADCQKRAIRTLKETLKSFKGQRVVIGTHGAVMTLMMGFYDSDYNLGFLMNTSKPDVYRMEFDGQKIIEIRRLFKEL